MSDYSDLQQFVFQISEETAQQTRALYSLVDDLQTKVAFFYSLVDSTQDISAQVVANGFYNAQNSLNNAALLMEKASKIGAEWSGVSVPVKVLVRKRMR